MKASELRIGNFYNQFGNETKISWVNLKELESAPEGQIWCKPIDLTEEWLLRFGFEDAGCLRFKKGIWDVAFMSDSTIYFRFDKQNIAELKHVHQLQNLYFALTGKELTITN
jgi:hypothetical protein